jgi:hypothetical protein
MSLDQRPRRTGWYSPPTCPRLLLALGVLPGCWREIHRPGCSEPTITELVDDEESPLGITANDLLAIATPGWTGSADDVNGDVADVTVGIARASGPANYVHADEIDIVTRIRHLGGGDMYLTIGVICVDAVEVPVDLTIASEAAAIDLDMDATLSSPLQAKYEGLYQADALASAPYDEADAPLPSNVDTSWEEQTIDARVEIQPDGLSAGSVKWVGTNADGDAADYADLLHWNID